MNRTKRNQSSSGESEEGYDGSMKPRTANSPGEKSPDNEETNESESAKAKVAPVQHNVSGLPSNSDHEANRLQTLQQADSQRSIVAVALAEERDRKMAAVSSARPSAMNSTAALQSTSHNLHTDGFRSDHLQRNGGREGAQIPQSLQDNDRFANIRLQQQMLLHQQQQQQQRLLHPNLSSVQPQGLIHNYSYQGNLQQQLALRERLQLQASAMHQQSYNNAANISTGMLHNVRLDNVDAQFRQRQLVELALLQNHQRNLWLSLNNDRRAMIPTVPYQTPQQFLSNDAAANLSTHLTTASSHLTNELSQQNNATIDAALKNHLQTAKTAARQQKRKLDHAVKHNKSGKSKSTKGEADAKLEYNFEPDNMKELSLATDSENLSEYQCLLRQQIVLFTVGSADIECSAQGRNKPIVLGQVGTLCRHCAKLKPGLRPSGAVYFPAKLSGLYQASQNMAINHFSNNCQSIPEPLRQRLLKLKEQKSAVLGGGKHFWANCARVIGVIEQDDQLRFSEDIATGTTEETEK